MGNWGYNPCKWSFLLITGGGPLCTWCYFSFFFLLLHDGLSFIADLSVWVWWQNFSSHVSEFVLKPVQTSFSPQWEWLDNLKPVGWPPWRAKAPLKNRWSWNDDLGRGLKDCQTLVDPTQKRRVVCRVVNVFFYIRTVLERPLIGFDGSFRGVYLHKA